MSAWRGGERGGGSMLALLGIAIVVPCTIAALSVGSLWLAHGRAASAADLGALAGAAAMVNGQEPCRAAEHIVAANGASLRSCAVDGAAVLVETEIRVVEPFGIELSVPAVSRAGAVAEG